MAKFTIDVKFWVSLDIEADSEEYARRFAEVEMATLNSIVNLPNGEQRIVTAFSEGSPDVYENTD